MRPRAIDEAPSYYERERRRAARKRAETRQPKLVYCHGELVEARMFKSRAGKFYAVCACGDRVKVVDTRVRG